MRLLQRKKMATTDMLHQSFSFFFVFTKCQEHKKDQEKVKNKRRLSPSHMDRSHS